ncbi:MAG TPA: chlorite dismutase family protein [Nitrososphaerales archaeon]|nr:chlorite dismutase family protein [Nitrososphaerales archaeon]
MAIKIAASPQNREHQGHDEQTVEEMREGRQFLKYTFYKFLPSWRECSERERDEARDEFRKIMYNYEETMIVKSFALIGTRGDSDFMLWTISERLEDFQDLLSDVLKSKLGRFVDTPYSYLSMTRKSEYIRDHRHPGQEGDALKKVPGNARYLFLYPFIKKREWYNFSPEERRRMMMDHIRTGHKFPSVKINTSYSFGLDDQEFVLSFETDHPSDFLELVMLLRSTETSKYTQLEIPIFTCISTPVDELVKLF